MKTPAQKTRDRNADAFVYRETLAEREARAAARKAYQESETEADFAAWEAADKTLRDAEYAAEVRWAEAHPV